MRDSDTTRCPSHELFEELSAYRSKHACLVVIHGAKLGEKFDLDKDETVIGRAQGADVSIQDALVSRAHAVILRRQGGYTIEDKHSTNGTRVNARSVSRKSLQDQDLIMIGDTVLKFISGDNIESAYHETMHKLATMDDLLQVYNRAYFIECLCAELSRSQRDGLALSLLMVDVDHFKRVNDSHGHQAGDFVLRRVADLMKRELRSGGLVGRYGGEEFAVLLPELGAGQAMEVAERLRARVEQTQLQWRGREIALTISVGLAGVGPQDPECIPHTKLIERADQALYRAKQRGRNTVVG